MVCFQSGMTEIDEAMQFSLPIDLTQSLLLLATFKSVSDALHARVDFYHNSLSYMQQAATDADTQIQEDQTALLHQLNLEFSDTSDELNTLRMDSDRAQQHLDHADQQATDDRCTINRIRQQEVDSEDCIAQLTDNHKKTVEALIDLQQKHTSDQELIFQLRAQLHDSEQQAKDALIRYQQLTSTLVESHRQNPPDAPSASSNPSPALPPAPSMLLHYPPYHPYL